MHFHFLTVFILFLAFQFVETNLIHSLSIYYVQHFARFKRKSHLSDIKNRYTLSQNIVL